MTALVDADYVAFSTGADVSTDPDRVDFLIEVASGLVCERCSVAWTDATAPVSVKQAVARLVSQALAIGSDSTGSTGAMPPGIKAEQIGDYRVEFASAAVAMDMRSVDDLLRQWIRGSAYSIKTDLGFDGTEDTTYVLGVTS